MRGRWVYVFGAAGLLMALGGAWWLINDWRFHSGLAWVPSEIGAGRFGEVKLWLLGLSVPWSRDPQAAYWLGVCERAAGNNQAALIYWQRVPRDARHGEWAEVERARLLITVFGRYAEAEQLLERSLSRPGPARKDVRRTLAELYFWEGRRDALRRLIRQGWNDSTERASELRNLWMIDSAPAQVEKVRETLDQAARQASDDDRVWLARANLAIQLGAFPEAHQLLEDCLKKRPRDNAVWRARLDWARATNSLREAEECLRQLPASALDDGETAELGAWIAHLLRDAAAEHRALDHLVKLCPGDAPALERLTVLNWNEGQRDRAQALRRIKADVDRARDRYRALLKDAVAPPQYEELGTLAEALGRRFEAEGWLTLAAQADPDNSAITQARQRVRGAGDVRQRDGQESLRDCLAREFGVSTTADRAAPATEPTAPLFVDDAEAAGLHFRFDSGMTAEHQLPETMSGGVAVLDFDGDGYLDVFLMQGGTFPPSKSATKGAGDRLFHNRGNGTFEDVTETSGIGSGVPGYSHGVAVGDIDNDGDPDLFVTRWRSYALYENQGNGRFVETTSRAGLAGDRDWPTSAAFADLDNDGDLDLYVCHYLDWDEANPRLCPRSGGQPGSKGAGANYGYCMPHLFTARGDHLFRNDGGRFVDVTVGSGIVDREGRGLGVIAVDGNGDGKIDIVVANDATANAYYKNLGSLKFEEVAFETGVACNSEGAFQAGMGIAAGDLDRDGLLDLAVTNFYGESTTFFRNLGSGMFADQTAAAGILAPSRFLLGFGIAIADANNDGFLDLVTANGHVTDEGPQFPYAMPTQLLLGSQGGKLVDAGKKAGAPWSVPRIGRGLASADLDNDGLVDFLIVSQNSPLAYFHNKTSSTHAVTLLLQGKASNRDAVGAQVVLVSGGLRQVAQRTGGGSYLSASDPRLHFGLGDRSHVDTIEVRWPSGHVDHYRDLPGDTGYRLCEGDSVPRPLAGFSALP